VANIKKKKIDVDENLELFPCRFLDQAFLAFQRNLRMLSTCMSCAIKESMGSHGKREKSQGGRKPSGIHALPLKGVWQCFSKMRPWEIRNGHRH